MNIREYYLNDILYLYKKVMSMITVLHLTNTDIYSDSRILKTKQSIASLSSKYRVVGIGVKLEEEKHKTNIQDKIEIFSINLISRKLILPNILRQIFSLIELSFKMFFISLKIKPDIIHCHDTMVLPLGVMIKFFTKVKLIYDAHELESNKNGLSNISRNMTFICEKFLWKFIDKLIVVSPSIGNWYNENIGKKETEIIMNSPILEKNISSTNTNYFRNKFSISNKSKIFLYIGILGKGRGIELVLSTFMNNKDISSNLIFLGYGELKNYLIEVSKKHENIHIHDAVSHTEVVSIAKSADIGLCLIENISLSDYYCLPNKLFEYAFAEIPVLASNFPDMKDVINKYQLGKICELSENEIYTAIKKFENEEELIKINSSLLYELSWQAQEVKLFRLYSSLN